MTFHHTLYQIFYGTNKFDKSADIQKCSSYMLTKENVEKWLSKDAPKKPEDTIQNIQTVTATATATNTSTINDEHICTNAKKEKTQTVFYPRQKNSLFWCVYIGAYGMGEYTMAERKSANVEMQERQKMFDYFRENPAKLKQGNTKVSNVLIQEIMADIMVETRDPNSVFHMLIAYSVFHKKTIYYVRKNTYIVFSYMEDSEDTDIENTLVIYAKNEKEYGICEDPTEEDIREIIDNKYRWVSYDKPLRGISTYKMSDLEEIARRLQVDVCNAEGVPLKKAELYAENLRLSAPFR